MDGAQWHTETNCRERDWGALDLLPKGGEDPEEDQRRRRHGLYFAPSGGESLASVIIRVDLILAYLNGRYPGRRVLMVCHGELMWAFRLRFEKLNQIQYRDMADVARGDERIHNGSVLRFSRQDPASGAIHDHFRFMQLATPWHADEAKRRPQWRTFVPHSYSNGELLDLVNRFPRYYEGSLSDPPDEPDS